MSVKKNESKFELLRTILVAGLIAIGFRSFLFEPFNIPSGSMMPTLLVGDYLFVSKYTYGYSRFSFPLGLIAFDGRIAESQPERGDIAVFRQPNKTSVTFIKRIVGLPGDQIQVKGGILHINGTAVGRQQVGEGGNQWCVGDVLQCLSGDIAGRTDTSDPGDERSGRPR